MPSLRCRKPPPTSDPWNDSFGDLIAGPAEIREPSVGRFDVSWGEWLRREPPRARGEKLVVRKRRPTGAGSAGGGRVVGRAGSGIRRSPRAYAVPERLLSHFPVLVTPSETGQRPPKTGNGK